MHKHYDWCCPFCDYVAKSRIDFYNHKKNIHPNKIFMDGGCCSYCGKHFKRKCELTCHEKRCYDNPNRIEYVTHKQTEETKLKISKTAKLNGKSGGYREGSGFKNIKKGSYKGIWCDSSWELAYLMYCLDHEVSIKRNTETFDYFYDGKKHTYLPDFKINDFYVEIKGRKTKQWEAKLKQFPKDKNLIVISEKEIQPYLKYVIDKYGRNFISLYE